MHPLGRAGEEADTLLSIAAGACRVHEGAAARVRPLQECLLSPARQVDGHSLVCAPESAVPVWALSICPELAYARALIRGSRLLEFGELKQRLASPWAIVYDFDFKLIQLPSVRSPFLHHTCPHHPVA